MRTKSQGKSCEGSNGVGERKWSSVATRIRKEEIKKDTSVFVVQIYKKAVRERKSQRDEETKSQRDEERKRGREEGTKRQKDKKTKRGRGEMSENEGEKRFFRKKTEKDLHISK